MSFAEVLEELPKLTLEERQLLISRALEIDGFPLSSEDEALIEKRMADHRANPESAIPFDEMMARVKDRLRR